MGGVCGVRLFGEMCYGWGGRFIEVLSLGFHGKPLSLSLVEGFAVPAVGWLGLFWWGSWLGCMMGG